MQCCKETKIDLERALYLEVRTSHCGRRSLKKVPTQTGHRYFRDMGNRNRVLCSHIELRSVQLAEIMDQVNEDQRGALTRPPLARLDLHSQPVPRDNVHPNERVTKPEVEICPSDQMHSSGVPLDQVSPCSACDGQAIAAMHPSRDSGGSLRIFKVIGKVSLVGRVLQRVRVCRFGKLCGVGGGGAQ